MKTVVKMKAWLCPLSEGCCSSHCNLPCSLRYDRSLWHFVLANVVGKWYESSTLDFFCTLRPKDRVFELTVSTKLRIEDFDMDELFYLL